MDFSIQAGLHVETAPSHLLFYLVICNIQSIFYKNSNFKEPAKRLIV